MHIVELRTYDGKFVAAGLIPPFPLGHLPRVITWGNRIFWTDDVNNPRLSGITGAYIYLETFGIALTDIREDYNENYPYPIKNHYRQEG